MVDSRAPNTCGKIADVELASVPGANPLDPLGYPPYTADRCTLAYVAKNGSLMLRDLRAGTEAMIVDEVEKPRRPSMAGGTLAWEATVGGKDVVRWRNNAGVVATIPSTTFGAGEPRAAEDAIAFTGYASADPKGDMDVFLFSISDQSITPLGDGPAQQRFPDIDATRVAWTDFSEAGPSGAFDPVQHVLADIVVYDRQSKTKHVRQAVEKQAFPLLVPGGNIAYLDWNSVRPQPKLMGYAFLVGSVMGDPKLDKEIPPNAGLIETNAPYIRPTVHGDTYEWLQNGVLWRRPTDLSTVAKTTGFSGNAFGVVAIDGLSIVAVSGTNGITLVGVDR